MEVNLTKEQKEYVEAYNKILNRLTDIQSKISALEEEAAEVLQELNDLRASEREEFPEE